MSTKSSCTGPVGLAVIGTGGFGRGMAEKVAASEKLRLVSCYDVVEKSRRETAEQFGCLAASGMDEIMADDSVEGVVIASPNFAHAENSIAAAKAGKHVFVDKPMANVMDEAYAIIDTCRDAGVILAVGHNYRRFGASRKLKQLVEEGVAGTIVSVEANFSHGGGMGLTPDQWRWYPDKCPALPLIQLGIHCVDILQHVLGPIAEVSSFMAHTAIPADNIDVTATALRFESGLVGYLGSNYVSVGVHHINVYGVEANLFLGWGTDVRIVRGGNKGEEIAKGPDADDRLEELEEFGDCIRTGAQPEVTGETALRNLAVVRAAIRSHEERRPVSIAEILAR